MSENRLMDETGDALPLSLLSVNNLLNFTSILATCSLGISELPSVHIWSRNLGGEVERGEREMEDGL